MAQIRGAVAGLERRAHSLRRQRETGEHRRVRRAAAHRRRAGRRSAASIRASFANLIATRERVSSDEPPAAARARDPRRLGLARRCARQRDRPGATCRTGSAMLDRYPHTALEASGEAVGLPAGVMGNSEVGHINIGSGRVVPQGLVVIDAAIADGAFATNSDAAGLHRRTCGGTAERCTCAVCFPMDAFTARSIIVEALIDAGAAAGVPLAIDAFLDGRDTPPRSAQSYLDRVRRAPRRARPARRASPASAGATTRWTATSAGSARESLRDAHRRRSASRGDVFGSAGGRVRARRKRRVRPADDRRRTAADRRRRRGDLLQLSARSRTRTDAGLHRRTFQSLSRSGSFAT